MKILIALSTLLLITFTGFSQGQSPNNIKWMELHTDHAKFVFPSEISDNAQKAANLIDYIYAYETKTLNTKPKKIPIILYNQSTVSNGFAGLRPRRSVWFSTPSQYATDLGTSDWYYTLGSHEFRHVVQYSKMNRHFTKLMSILFGQTGILMGEYSIPNWFFEGDAICAETGLSDGGRGRIPQFEMGIRTILLSDQKISYDKAKFGSYKTFYPGHYNFGWLMASQARVMFGPDVFDKALNTTSKISFWPYAFSIGLKKASGLNERKMYKAVMNRLDSVWTSELSDIELTAFSKINTANKDSWTRYSEINYYGTEGFIAKKSSLKSDIPAFYIIKNNGEEIKLDATDAGMFDVNQNKIVYTLTLPDPRWQTRDFTDIFIYNIVEKKESRLTKNQKLFSPVFSPDGNSIAAIEYNEAMQSYIVLLNASDGKEIKRIESPAGSFIRTPRFDETGDRLVMALSNESGTALYMYQLSSDDFVQLTEFSRENIGRPCFFKNFIIYNSPYSGIGNIYALDIDTKMKYRITSSKFGAYNPDILNDRMVYAEYTPEGYDIAEIDLDPDSWTPIENIKPYIFETAEIIKSQESKETVLDPDLIPDRSFEIKPYNKLKDVVNIHSWQIFTSYPTNVDAIDLNNPEQLLKPEIGVGIYSANLLNTVFASVGGSYDINEKTYSSNVDLIFKKYYPEFNIGASWGQRMAVYEDMEDRWEELKTTAGITLPLDLSKGIYYKGANIGIDFTYIQNKDKTYRYISEPGEGDFSSLSYTGSIYAFRKQATRDINPKFGYFIYLLGRHIPFNTQISGYQYSGLTSFYLPGIFNHHSINLKFGYEKQRSYDPNASSDYYWFSTPQSFPRGYNFPGFDEIQSMSVNYALPVLYPEFNIGPFAYFKRIRADLFFDMARFSELSSSNDYTVNRSVGLELLVQAYFLRLGEPIEFGGRISYLFDNGTGESIVPEFLVLGISF